MLIGGNQWKRTRGYMKIKQQKMTLKEQTLLIISLSLLITLAILVVVKQIELKKQKNEYFITETIIFFDDDPSIERGMSSAPTAAEVTKPAPTAELTIPTKTIPSSTTTTTTTIKRTTQATKTTITTTAALSTFNDNVGSNVYNITSEERDMLARLLYLEGGSTSRKCQKMIMEVVFNHYDVRGGKTSLKDIVYAKNMFTPASRISKTKATKVQYEIVDEVCRDGVTILPKNVLYFRASYYHSWATPYIHIDNVYFSY